MANERFINARNRRRGFTTVLNQMLDDPTISLEAKGLLSILLSNKDDWKINMKEIITRSKNGRDAHYKVINELINSGYVFRIQIKEKGKFKEVIYVFSDNKEEVQEAVKELENQGLLPHPENQETVFDSPLPENPDTEKPDPENQDINNTTKNKTNTNKTNFSRYVGSDRPDPADEEAEEGPALRQYIVDRFAGVYKLTGYARQNLIEFMDDHGETLVAEALERTIKAEKDQPIAYIKGILKKWSAAGVKTKGDIEEYERKFRESRQQKRKADSKEPADPLAGLPKSIRQQMEEQDATKEQAAAREQTIDPQEVAKKRAKLLAKIGLKAAGRQG